MKKRLEELVTFIQGKIKSGYNSVEVDLTNDVTVYVDIIEEYGERVVNAIEVSSDNKEYDNIADFLFDRLVH